MRPTSQFNLLVLNVPFLFSLDLMSGITTSHYYGRLYELKYTEIKLKVYLFLLKPTNLLTLLSFCFELPHY